MLKFVKELLLGSPTTDETSSFSSPNPKKRKLGNADDSDEYVYFGSRHCKILENFRIAILGLQALRLTIAISWQRRDSCEPIRSTQVEEIQI
jgi:hypothetical protein